MANKRPWCMCRPQGSKSAHRQHNRHAQRPGQGGALFARRAGRQGPSACGNRPKTTYQAPRRGYRPVRRRRRCPSRHRAAFTVNFRCRFTNLFIKFACRRPARHDARRLACAYQRCPCSMRPQYLHAACFSGATLRLSLAAPSIDAACANAAGASSESDIFR